MTEQHIAARIEIIPPSHACYNPAPPENQTPPENEPRIKINRFFRGVGAKRKTLRRLLRLARGYHVARVTRTRSIARPRGSLPAAMPPALRRARVDLRRVGWSEWLRARQCVFAAGSDALLGTVRFFVAV